MDASGQVIDGDQIMAVLALGLKATGRLEEANACYRKARELDPKGADPDRTKPPR